MAAPPPGTAAPGTDHGTLYHLVQAPLWARCKAEGRPYMPPTYEADGFIHLTKDAALLLGVANHFYKDVPGEFLVLAIDSKALSSPVAFEPAAPVGATPALGAGGGEAPLFPHLYGALDLGAVTAELGVARGAGGAHAQQQGAAAQQKMERLPATTDDQVHSFQAEYSAAFESGSPSELEAAKCRLIWALVHADSRAHQQRGADLAAAALDNDQRTQDQDRELRYYLAVAQFKLGRCLDARRTLTSLLQDYPDFRQGAALKGDVDERVVKDGLLGLGVAGAVAAVALGVLLGSGRRR
ncbi:FIS1A [Scenedesmus sp. PABB004]|nr:FIS1A [Scenedesmus sp. PABB004]